MKENIPYTWADEGLELLITERCNQLVPAKNEIALRYRAVEKGSEAFLALRQLDLDFLPWRARSFCGASQRPDEVDRRAQTFDVLTSTSMMLLSSHADNPFH